MKFKLFKYYQKTWMPISIQNIHEGDLIKALNQETFEWLPNNDKGEEGVISKAVEDAYYNEEDKSWSIKSEPHSGITIEGKDGKDVPLN